MGALKRCRGLNKGVQRRYLGQGLGIAPLRQQFYPPLEKNAVQLEIGILE